MNAEPAACRAASPEPPPDGQRRPQRPPTVAVRHSLPGRTRLHVPALFGCDSPAAIGEAVTALPAVTHAVVRMRSRSLLIHHDCGIDAQTVRKHVAQGLTGLLPAGHPAPGRDRQSAASPASAGSGDRADSDWFVIDRQLVLERLKTNGLRGLDIAEAEARLAVFGPNRIEERPPPGTLQYIARQVMTAPVGLLAGSAAVSVLSGGLADAIGIGAAIAVNALIGAATEQQSEKTIRMLSTTQQGDARVMRNGRQCVVSATHLVPGDLLVLAPGDVVPADARLVSCASLSVDESALTGESLPVHKSVTVNCDADTPLADRVNMVFGGTTVTGGNASAVVVATGYATEVGRIQLAADTAAAPETAMQTQLNELGGQLTKASVVACGLVFALGLLRGGSMLTMLKTAISLGVAAVPEGLPAVATTTLALGVRSMRRKNLLIRNINAVETLGSVQTVCLDKTGTLTENRMAPAAIHVGMRTLRADGDCIAEDSGRPVTGDQAALQALLRMIVLCNDSVAADDEQQRFHGAPTENALLELAELGGLDIDAARKLNPRLVTRYRTETQPWMHTVHEGDDESRLLVVKGSPREVLDMCASIQLQHGGEPLTDYLRTRIVTENEAWTAESLRVLGVAFRRCPPDGTPELRELTWLGLVGVADPLRQGMRELISGLHQAGVATVMITGDQMGTAAAIGRQLALSSEGPLRVLDSRDLAKLEPELLDALVGKTHVFARVSPANKLQIVRALQRSGQVVAMTGDGVNDGPALKAADVGIAMGDAGNDVARSVADVVVKGNRLESVILALGQGRATYANVRKSLHYLIASNLSEIEVMLGATLLGLDEPLTPIQLLWINLVTDVLPAIALALEPPEPGIMRVPPRAREESIVTGAGLKRMLKESGAMATGAMGSLVYGLSRYGPGPESRSMILNTLIAAQMLHAVSCHSESRAIGPGAARRPNGALLAATGGSLALQLTMMSVPALRRVLQAGRLSVFDLMVSGLCALGPMLVNELFKPGLPGRASEGSVSPTETRA